MDKRLAEIGLPPTRADKVNFYEWFGLTKTKNTSSKGGIDYVIMEKCTSQMI